MCELKKRDFEGIKIIILDYVFSCFNEDAHLSAAAAACSPEYPERLCLHPLDRV